MLERMLLLPPAAMSVESVENIAPIPVPLSANISLYSERRLGFNAIPIAYPDSPCSQQALVSVNAQGLGVKKPASGIARAKRIRNRGTLRCAMELNEEGTRINSAAKSGFHLTIVRRNWYEQWCRSLWLLAVRIPFKHHIAF